MKSAFYRIGVRIFLFKIKLSKSLDLTFILEYGYQTFSPKNIIIDKKQSDAVTEIQ